MKLVYRRPWLYPKQRRALFSPYHFTVIEASTKSGKSAGAMIWLFEQALRLGRPGRNFWWVAPSYGQCKIIYRRYKRAIGQQFYRHNDSELTLTLINGAVIAFKSGEIPDNLYGEDVHAAVFDEAPRGRAEAFEALVSTLTATDGQLRMIGHPKGKGTWHYKLGQQARQAMADDPKQRELGYFRLTWRDAAAAINPETGKPVIRAATVERARRVMPEAAFRELYEAEASEAEGNPFGSVHLEACRLQPADEVGPPVIWGWDLGRAEDWTWGTALDANGSIARMVRFQLPWGGEAERRIIRETAGLPAWIDATGAGDPIVSWIQATDDAALWTPYVFTAPSKQQLMVTLQTGVQGHIVGLLPERFGEDEARWDEETRALGEVLWLELESFEYRYGFRNVLYSAPEGMHDDGVCSLGLAYLGLVTQRPIVEASGAPTGIEQSSLLVGLEGAGGPGRAGRWSEGDVLGGTDGFAEEPGTRVEPDGFIR